MINGLWWVEEVMNIQVVVVVVEDLEVVVPGGDSVPKTSPPAPIPTASY